MAITYKFKGGHDIQGYGYYCYIEEDQLVIEESWPHKGGEIYRGTYSDATAILDLLKTKAPGLYDNIVEYYLENPEVPKSKKLMDLKPGDKFISNKKEYMLIDLNLSTCFISPSGIVCSTVCAINTETFKVYCFDKNSEVSEGV